MRHLVVGREETPYFRKQLALREFLLEWIHNEPACTKTSCTLAQFRCFFLLFSSFCFSHDFSKLCHSQCQNALHPPSFPLDLLLLGSKPPNRRNNSLSSFVVPNKSSQATGVKGNMPLEIKSSSSSSPSSSSSLSLCSFGTRS
jgi:hypothetical protein